jgi:hypothetical protein
VTNLATQQDLEDIWRPLTSDEATSGRFDRLLGTAEALLRQKVPNLDTRLASSDPVYALSAQVVRNAIATMVKNYLVNPAGVTSQTTGPFSTAFDRNGSARGALTVTPDIIAMLTPRTASSSIGSIRLRAGLSRAEVECQTEQMLVSRPRMLLPDTPE